MSSTLQAMLDGAAAAGVFPQARALVLVRGERYFEGGAGGALADTIFDFASITKVMSSTALFMSLWGEGKLSPDTAVSRYFPNSAAGEAGVSLGDLLFHRSGLPAYRHLFFQAMRTFPLLFDPGCASALREQVRAELVRAALAVPLERPPRSAAVYSDLGFILLGEALAAEAQAPLDEAFDARVAARLELRARFHRLSARSPAHAGSVPTGRTRPRELAPGQEPLPEPLAPRPSPPGEVDDDNAWVMDGVSGHAGLFGTAGDLAAYGQAVLDDLRGAGHLAPPGLWQGVLRPDSVTPGSTRTLGFESFSSGTVGHLGFTGTALWLDPARELVTALCTNRTFHGRSELRIREFRPRFRDAVLDEL